MLSKTAAVLASVMSLGVRSDSTGWDRLETTWALLAWDGFFGVPTSVSKAKSDGWNQVSSCDNDASMGALYMENDDLSVMPSYDENSGELLGLTLGTSYVGSDSLQSGQPWFEHKLSNGTSYYAIQFAFQDPSSICGSGEKNDSVSDTIGAGLWIRQGNSGKDSDWFQPPLEKDSSVLSELGYVQGKCFPQMGEHWWRYDYSPDVSCSDLYPTFLLYNSGKLNAFGIAVGQPDFPYQTSKKWEHPKGTDTEIFFADGLWPTCLDTSRVLSTLHVYLNNPAWMDCL